jgi:hypothetical protein
MFAGGLIEPNDSIIAWLQTGEYVLSLKDIGRSSRLSGAMPEPPRDGV